MTWLIPLSLSHTHTHRGQSFGHILMCLHSCGFWTNCWRLQIKLGFGLRFFFVCCLEVISSRGILESSHQHSLFCASLFRSPSLFEAFTPPSPLSLTKWPKSESESSPCYLREEMGTRCVRHPTRRTHMLTDEHTLRSAVMWRRWKPQHYVLPSSLSIFILSITAAAEVGQ